MTSIYTGNYYGATTLKNRQLNTKALFTEAFKDSPYKMFRLPVILKVSLCNSSLQTCFSCSAKSICFLRYSFLEVLIASTNWNIGPEQWRSMSIERSGKNSVAILFRYFNLMQTISHEVNWKYCHITSFLFECQHRPSVT